MKHIAKALAAQGRGPDTTLVHMAPHEVDALAKLGGLESLPKNPKTGLPEAGLLSMVLPMAAAYMTGGSSLWLQAAAGAAAGGIGAKLEGGNMMRGALMGGATAGLTGAAKAAFTPGGAQLADATMAAPSAPPTDFQGFPGVAGSPAIGAARGAAPGVIATPQVGAQPWTVAEQFKSTAMPSMPPQAAQQVAAANPSMMSKVADAAGYNPKTTLGIGALGAYGLSQAMQPAGLPPAKGRDPYAGKATSGSTALTADQLAWNTANPQGQQYYLNPTPTINVAPSYAEGGQVQTQDLFNAPLMPGHPRQGLDPQMQGYAQGGVLNLQQHSKHLDPMFLKGSGDGMSDSIDAQIDGGGQHPAEPIKVANNEYIIPADVVSHLGNGSSDAGAKKLDKMSAKVRKARTGKVKQAPQIKAGKYIPV